MKKNNIIGFVLCTFVLFACLSACQQKQAKNIPTDDFTSGRLPIVADESFAPILGQEQYIFEALNTKAHLDVLYKTESEAINLLINDSVRTIVAARDLTAEERSIIAKRGSNIAVNRFAIDAVTLIVNKTSNDTAVTVSAIKKMLNGQGDVNKVIVFDSPNSSLVRYLKDFSGNKELKQKNIYALKSNKEVIKYTSEHPDAIGIIGFGWLNDATSDYASYVDNVKVVGVRDEASKNYPDSYFKPSQETLVLKQYPLSRSLYIINCTGKMGLATGFATFLSSARGQRIILKSGLLPDSIPSREINIHK